MSAKALLTLLLVDTKNNHDLIASNSNKLLDTSDTSSGQFGKKDHAIDVIVFEEFDIGSHFGDLPNLVRISARYCPQL